jgi:hypothetical protein
MAIQIGKYKRPGIFLEEYDNSVISSPVIEGLTNLVIGVSKKGPVNTPIRVTNTTDLESIFGQLDRGLERKGSFFHRTVSKMLESAPVYAINLLLTDDNLDVIEYKSLSTSADYTNDVEREGPYRRFFDTTGFWKRDTESFINLTKNNTGYSERAFSLTNLSDKFVTVFVFKSAITGFDRSLIEWYGSAEKMPSYVGINDWASDYMVDVVIVGGDWSNYKELAVDSRWSAYFNATGLRKEKVREFTNDRNITLLGYYEGLSLIPYFRDTNGRNIFIETVVNRDTDRTGVFCTFNNDLVETDFFNGRLDLIGHTIAGKNETNIDFLSYQDVISEEIEIISNPLDLPGNVTALLGGSSSTSPAGWLYNSVGDHHVYGTPKTKGWVKNGSERTSYFAEGYIYNVGLESDVYFGTNSIVATYSVLNTDYEAFLVVGDKQVILDPQSVNLKIDTNNYLYSNTAATYSSAFVLDSTGKFKVVNSTNSNNPSVASSDTVLAYVKFKVLEQKITGSPVWNNISLEESGFKNFTFGSTSADYYVEAVVGATGSVKVSFIDTDTSISVKEYAQYRRFKMFNRLVDLIDSPNKEKMVMLKSHTDNLLTENKGNKISLADISISNIVTSSTRDKSFELKLPFETTELNDILNGFLVFYTVDDEFILGAKGAKTQVEVANESEFGVVAKYSKLYTRYYDGVINTGDFFYANKIPQGILENADATPYVDGSEYISDVYFFDGESTLSVFGLTEGLNVGPTSSAAGYDYIAFNSTEDPSLELYDIISIKGATTNTGTFTIISENQIGNIGTASGIWNYVYKVNEETSYERVQNVSIIEDFNTKHYLKMYVDNAGKNLNISLMNDTFTSYEEVNTNTAGTIGIKSAITNYKQSLEVEVPTGYVQVPNKVLVNGARYTEVKVGDFLEAFYDESTLRVGEYPRKLTRVVSKRQYSGNADLVEITCDSRIKVTTFGTDLQTMRYKTVDNYSLTYKAISLKGFRVREASLPDGTEAKQNTLLNLVSKGTPMFKAITNKEAIDFRYLIDSFGLGLTEKSKQQLVDICGDRLDAFGFLNMPSMKSFKNSSSPSFVNKEGVLQTEFIAKGGDPESGPAFLYSFGDGAGTTCVGYFMPYLSVNDNGRPLDMPPASFAATTYMRKHTSNVGSITPWTIAAGVTNGRITNIAGLEMDFTPTDIEWLNGAQINPIVFKRNRGNIIETENTAQTLYKSALSYIHVREVLIELERELSRMLLDFQWRYNTPDIRSEIKLRADVICETYVSRNGLYNYFNKMDEENNTTEIIDNQIGVLDTYVEPIKGMGIIVNNVTILRTGAIAAGGFA